MNNSIQIYKRAHRQCIKYTLQNSSGFWEVVKEEKTLLNGIVTPAQNLFVCMWQFFHDTQNNKGLIQDFNEAYYYIETELFNDYINILHAQDTESVLTV